MPSSVSLVSDIADESAITSEQVNTANTFGTFAGVFTPTLLTILGAIMYLRLGWVVGNAGLLGAIVIILLAHVITISTGLAVASTATNIRVGAGGAFAIIAQSLGLEVGGSVGVPLYLAQTVSITLYVLAFTEGWLWFFPSHPSWLIAPTALIVIIIIAYISTRTAFRLQFIILAIVALSLVSIFLGSFPIGDNQGMVHTPTLIGDFPLADFWSVFAVYFPAVTGIMAGVSMSGSLRNPRRSIPLGTMTAILLAMVIYLLLIYWLSRVATPEELLTNFTIMIDRALIGFLVLLGLLGATFSSALGSLVAAPRVLQALGHHNVMPFGRVFARQTPSGEPRQSLIFTASVSIIVLFIALALGGLDVIAPLITMFFLLTYFVLNAVVLIEQMLNMVSFRPTFAIPRLVPLVGMVSSLAVMFILNWIFGVVAIVLTLIIYGYLGRRQLRSPWSDVRSGLFIAVAEWAAERVTRLPPATERTWKPNILAPAPAANVITGSYRFMRQIAAPKGSVHILGIYGQGRRADVEDLPGLSQAFLNDGIFSQTTTLEMDDYYDGILAALEVLSSVMFRPNILFLPLLPDSEYEQLEALLRKDVTREVGVVMLARHTILAIGRQQVINVWVREQGPEWKLGLRLANLDLLVLLAYQVTQNWHGRLNLCMVVDDEVTQARAVAYLEELIDLARLPRDTGILVIHGDFETALVETPPADLNMFGLQRQPDLAFIKRIVTIVDASCVFVRDSGQESALA